MSISSIAIKRPVFATVISIVIVIFGIVGYTYLGVREYPSVDPPVVTVSTNYPGANADIIESQIVEPLEESISGIAGIRSLTSESSDGRGSISVEFELGISMDAAANDVRDRVSRAVRNLPPDADPPVIIKSDADAETIVTITVSSKKRTLLELTEIGNNIFKERLQTIPGVSEIRLWGEKKYAMRLEMDPKKIAAYQLTPLDVRDALLDQNVELPSGRIEGYEKEMTIRTSGRLTSEEDFNNMIISEKDNTLVRFKDIGRARLAPENERTLMRGNGGVPMIGVALTPQAGANYIAIADETYRRVALIQKELPEDIELGVALDRTTTIRKAITEVEETIFIAFVLVVMVIFVFLRDWRTTLIPAIAIPISLIGSFFVMYVADFSINILTLLAIVLATGIVVDDAIVVMENIYSKIEKGMNPVEAAHKGSAEIVFAIVSTTITLCAVFLPIIFLEGLTGRLFREFGIVVMGAVLISALVSLTLTPMMSSKLLKNRANPGKFYQSTERFYASLIGGYERVLRKFMVRRWLSFIIIPITIGVIYLMMILLPRELAPLEDKSRIRVYSTAPEGTSFEKMDDYTMQLINLTDTLQERESLLSVIAPSFSGSGSANSSFVRITLVPPEKRNRTQAEVVEDLNSKLPQYNFARSFVVQEQTISTGRGSRSLPVQYILQAPSLDKLKAVLPQFLEEVRISPVFEANDFDLKFNKPELKLQINREKAREMGVVVRDIAETLQLFFSGQRFGYFIFKGKQYQVLGQATRDNRNEIQDIARITIRNNNGNLVRLDNLVSMQEVSSPPQLYRYNRYVAATISAAPSKGYTIGEGIEEMDRIAANLLDESFSTSLAGTSKDFAESSDTLLFAFLFALVLIFLALSAQFESFFDPLTIMLTVPLALAGSLLTLWMFDHTLNIFSQIGIIVLVGIVTKNGILIVEFANQRKEQGNTVIEAVIGAAAQRFRPIIMTSFSTILGALPIAMAFGGGATSRIPMGIAIIGGLIFSLSLTLFIIPALYVYMEHLGIRVKRMLTRSSETADNLVIPHSVKVIVFFMVLFSLNSLKADGQELSFENAVQEMLAKNFDIRIESNNQEITSRLNNAGNAGFLPTLDARFNYESSSNNTDQKFFDDRIQKVDGAKNDAMFASVLLNWTLFDGFRMFAIKSILDSDERLSTYYLRAASEEAVLMLANLYYQIVQRIQLLEVYRESLSISEQRHQLAAKRKAIGSSSKQEVLQALTDWNADSVQVMSEVTTIENLKTNVNLLLARDVFAELVTPNSIPLDSTLVLTDLLESAESFNINLLIARENILKAQQEVKVSRSYMFPEVGVYAGYDLNKSTNDAGLLRSNQTHGPGVGVFVNFNLFNGLRNYNNLKVREIEQENSEISNQQSELTNQAAIVQAYEQYQLALDVMRLERDSQEQADENVRIALKRFELGNISAVEFRDIQLQAVEARSRLLGAQYSIRINELVLRRLSGKLLL